MPAKPRWLLAIPDAIRQLEALDRDLLTRRDVEKLFGVSRARRRRWGKLFALAQALTVDYERFETIVGKGERSG